MRKLNDQLSDDSKEKYLFLHDTNMPIDINDDVITFLFFPPTSSLLCKFNQVVNGW